VVKASYALGDSRIPVLVALAAMCVNVAGDLTVGLSFGVAGLAASTSAAMCLAAAANTWLLARRHDGVSIRPLAGLVGRTALAAGVATIAAGAAVYALGLRLGEGQGAAIAQVTVAALCICSVFVLILRALRAAEVEVLRDALALIRHRRR
jgi:putative peptidoglycan lipid II flippase